jgi:hypothetical protein
LQIIDAVDPWITYHFIYDTKGNQTWILQRNWQHRVHKKKTNITLENTERAIKSGHYRETGNIGYTRKRQT